MKMRKMTPQEMALAVALGMIAVERASASLVGNANHSANDSAKTGARIDAPKYTTFDVQWMKDMGIEL